jgi:REP element-mobilizing transposase RayT
MAKRPHKLPRAHYVGRRTHFLSACTFCRHALFRDPATCELVIEQLLRASRKHGFVNIAYVLMPDHCHALVEGTRDDSDFVKWLDLFRQLSGYAEKKRSASVLWQEGYWDYTLRDDDSVAGIASYIAWNPVEAGLVSRPELYPYSGSETSTVLELAAVPPHKPRVGDC